MNLPSDNVAQSILLKISMNKLIDISNIDAKPFDVNKLKDFY